MAQNGIDFVQKSADFDEESITSQNPNEFVYLATKGKMTSAIKLFGSDQVILCADTVVVSDQTILRKAKNREDARAILQKQSGKQIEIITCTMFHKANLDLIDLSVTTYQFLPFDERKIESYLSTNQWQGKAGACMVEGFCQEFIQTQAGLTSTAMGLTIEKILPFI